MYLDIDDTRTNWSVNQTFWKLSYYNQTNDKTWNEKQGEFGKIWESFIGKKLHCCMF